MTDEKAIIQRVLKGETTAFSFFVDRYQDMAITIAYRITSNMQDAEDIVQNSFVKAFHNIHTFRFSSKFSTWLYRIVYNTAISSTKSNFIHTNLVDYKALEYASADTNDWNTLEAIDKEDRVDIINEALEKIPKEDSLILSLFYLEENSIKDIKLITGLSEANIKVKLYRARKSLKEVLTKNYKHEINTVI